MKKLLLLVGLIAMAVSCASQKPVKNNENNQEIKMNTERLTYFSFDHHNSMVRFNGEKYSVTTMKDGRIHVVIDESFPGEKEFYLNDSTIFDELLEIVKTYEMDKYKSDYMPEWEVTDGDSWSLYYKYDTKRSVSSGGYMAWPDNYRDMRHALSEYFKKWREYKDGVLAIDFFKFTQKNKKGRDIEYTMERGEKEATVTLRNAEEGVKGKTVKVSNDILQELMEAANVSQLKSTMYDYHTDDENATRSTYFVRYNTGDTISGYTCHTQYPSQKESMMIEFFSRWLK